MIERPTFQPTRYFLDSRGHSLFDIFPGISGGQINVGVLQGTAIKAFHRHYLQKDHWSCVAGNIHVICITPRTDEEAEVSESTCFIDHFFIGEKNPGVLTIPEKSYHGYSNSGCKTSSLLYHVTRAYDPSNPDEYRLSWDALGSDIWKPENK